MLDVLFLVVAYAKVIDNKTKNDVSGCMAPKAGSVLDWVVAKGCKVFDKLFMGKFTCLW